MTIVVAVILAGGKSLRFGSPKAEALLEGKFLIHHVCERLLPQVSDVAVAGESGLVDVKHLRDGSMAGAGPMAGIISGLKWAASVKATHLLSAPCDLPLIPRDLVHHLMNGSFDGSERDVPYVLRVNGRVENACALWPLSCASRIEHLVVQKEIRAVHQVLEQLGAKCIEVVEADLDGSFFNVNTRTDLDRLVSNRTMRHGCFQQGCRHCRMEE